MAPHEETLQNQRLQGFRFSPRRGSQEARGLSRGLLVILPFFFFLAWAIASVITSVVIRAVRTFAEAALAYIGTGAVVLGDVNWIAALSAGGFGFVTAILLALTGLPEAEDK